jgi:hypothetical protein
MIRATSEERQLVLPGDELIAAPKLSTTHAVDITATCEDVWPWLVQMGQGRGGFYSYTFIENLLGCRMKNANKVHSEWQDLAVGDLVNLHPKASPLSVVAIESSSYLVLQSTAGFPWTWAFILMPNANRCRLLIRTRVSWSKPLLGCLLWPVMSPGHYVMERKMLLGIRSRVLMSRSV